MTLTLDEANRVAEGAMEHARSIDILVCVAVCDAGGKLVSFQRMDGAIWPPSTAARARPPRRLLSAVRAATSPSARTIPPSAASSQRTAGT